ncbi:MAG: LysE family transporter, partial [Gammaproteobacteria bacterium]|nr:LysE family transporter [Gammaproteobacteria bacterium]
MSFLMFLIEAILVSLSGVLAPGPVTSVSVGYGSENPRAGAWIAVGHGLVELPVMVGVFLGVGAVMGIHWVRTAIALVGGVFLLYLGIDMLRNIRQEEISGTVSARSPLAAGALLSLGNPYFLIWWATVGAGLILRSTEFGLLGLAAFAVGHWLCDLGWDTFLSALSFKGGQFFGKRFQQVIFAISGAFLLFYSGKLLWEGVRAV